MYVILCVIDQPQHLKAVLKAWKEVGIGGVTVLESTGQHRLSEQPHIPFRYALGAMNSERSNVTLFSVVENEEIIQRCLEQTEAVIGDFGAPNTGIFTAWPLAVVKGANRKHSE